MKIQGKMYGELVKLRDQLECMEENNDSLDYVLESIPFILDDIIRGYDMTEESVKWVREAKCVLRGGKLLKVWLQEQEQLN